MANNDYKLLSVEADAKTTKGSDFGYLTGILYMAPATEAGGIDMCPMASDECRKACLYGAGMAGVFPSVKRSRIERTKFFLRDPKGFKYALAADIRRLICQAEKRGMVPAVRINGTSDQPKLALEMARLFPQVQFYDYTKLPNPWKRTTSNYHLTFSHSGTNLEDCRKALKHGINVAVVFAGGLPKTWYGYRVLDGDTSDLRFLDPAGVVIGLKPKGDAKKLETGGFVQIGAAA